MYEIMLWSLTFDGKNDKVLFCKKCKTKITMNKYHLEALKLFKKLKAVNNAKFALDIYKDKKIVWFLEA